MTVRRTYTESSLRAQMCEMFMKYLGCKRGDKKHHEIIDAYNTISPLPRGYKMTYKDDWCAATVSAIGHMCGLGEWVFPECSCSKMIEKYKAAGRWEENDAYVPKVGDLVMYDWDDGVNYATTDNTGAPEHVGMVCEVGAKQFKVIEGNKGTASECGIRVMNINGRYIRGFCKPDYKTAAAVLSAGPESASSQTTPSKTTEYCSVQLPVLVEGMDCDAVAAMRRLLAAARCGSGTITTKFDKNTTVALTTYQRGHKLDVDGSCGPATWTSLLGGKMK